MHKPWQNAEGYTDNTAYQGTKDIIRAESAAERKNRLIIQIFRLVCELAGFEIVGRVTLKEKKSGREFKQWALMIVTGRQRMKPSWSIS